MPFVDHVDQRVEVASYTDGALLVRVALAAEADAIHPGWGFLAEDAAFARLVQDTEGLLWIGPRAEAIELLGDKVRAKQTAAGITPLLQGGAGDESALLEAARATGWPVLIKGECWCV